MEPCPVGYTERNGQNGERSKDVAMTREDQLTGMQVSESVHWVPVTTRGCIEFSRVKNFKKWPRVVKSTLTTTLEYALFSCPKEEETNPVLRGVK